MSEGDLEPLRAAGLDDRAIVDANQVASYFNYVNRVADGLGVELEPSWPAVARRPRTYALGRREPALPSIDAGALPWLEADEMREVDRVMTEELGVALAQMMENAGSSLAELARRLLGGAAGRRILVLAGPGGNGGGGLAAARHRAVAGADVEVRTSSVADRLAPVTRLQHEIVRRLGIRILASTAEPLPDADLVVDALLGYGQTGAPRGEPARLIEASGGRRILSLDVPSGLELATGTAYAPCVRAEATMTLALPKKGLRAAGAGEAVGDLYLADISVPAGVYERLGLEYSSPFGAGRIVRIGVRAGGQPSSPSRSSRIRP